MKKLNKKRLLILITIFIILFGYYLSLKFNIFSIKCPTKYFFHIYCPGCGVSRMILSILKLDFKQAFYYNRLFFILLPFIIILLIDFIIGYLFDKPYKIITRIPKSVYIILGVIIILFGIIRNFPCFDYLRPILID